MLIFISKEINWSFRTTFKNKFLDRNKPTVKIELKTTYVIEKFNLLGSRYFHILC